MAGWKGTVPSQQEQGRYRRRDRAMQPCARASVSIVLYFSINNMSERGLGGVLEREEREENEFPKN
jgi:hypothetical protein